MPRGLRSLRIPQGLSHAQSILRGRSEQPLRRHHQGPDVLRRAGFAAPPRDADGDATKFSTRFAKLLAPILVFTAEEAWGYLGRDGLGSSRRNFPKRTPTWRDRQARQVVTSLLKLRGVIGQAVEQARQEKLIGNALEAAVVLRCDAADDLRHSARRTRGVFHSQRSETRAGRNRQRLDHEDAASKVRALLAASTDRRKERGASGFVRSLRGRGERFELDVGR